MGLSHNPISVPYLLVVIGVDVVVVVRPHEDAATEVLLIPAEAGLDVPCGEDHGCPIGIHGVVWLRVCPHVQALTLSHPACCIRDVVEGTVVETSNPLLDVH
jgi:hypothetical protein